MSTVEERMMQDAAAAADTVYSMSVGDEFKGKLEGRSDVDWVKVELVAGMSYDIRLQGIGFDGVVNTVLRIYNSAGEEVAFNNNVDLAGLDLKSMVEFSPETGGDYFISAGNFLQTSLNTSGGYLMTVFDEEDNNPDTPYTVSAGGRFNGTLDSKFDEDWIRVDLVEGKTYSISLNGIGPDADTDTVLRLYNSAGEQVAFHDDVDYAAGKVNSLLMFSPAATGTYYISAGAYRGNPTQDHSGRYQVAVYDRDGHVLIGTEGNDSYLNDLIGGPGDDELDGKEGNDWLEGGGGADMLRGGEGVDDARYLYSDAGVEVRLHDGTARGGDAEGDTFAGVQIIEFLDADGTTREVEVPDIEYLYGSYYDDILVGAHGRNRLLGYYGDDELDGREGNDTLVGGPGADALKGGEGFDYAAYYISGASVEVRLYDGTARGGDAEGDTFAGVQIIEFLDADGTTREVEVPDIEGLYGSYYDDILVGAHGDNNLQGSHGNDELDGREGDDLLSGGAGADMLRGGDGLDWANYFSSDAGVEVRLHDGTARGGDAEGDTFAGVQIIEFLDADGETREVEVPDIENLYGSGYDDILVGAHGNNRLYGLSGNDELDGREGDDLLAGGPGADVLRGGPGSDRVDYLDSDAGVEVRLHDGTARGGDAEGDTFAGRKTIEYLDADGETREVEVPDIENLTGSDYNDILVGAHGNNRLSGGPGNDELDGGMGSDTLEGGPGNDLLRGGQDNDKLDGGEGDDTFFFAPGGGDDTVLDFGMGEDKVDLTAFEDIQSIEDLDMEQQESNLVIDLSGLGGGTITLQNYNEMDIMDAYFIFFTDDVSALY